jgi:hypothetical protein
MNKKLNPDRALLHFMLRAQQIACQDGRSDKGYAMVLVSMISIAMLSMLAAYLTISGLNKSSTSAYVDGTNTFYVAESGLNQRAQQLRDKFINYSLPNGLSPGQANLTDYVPATNITNCFNLATNLTASATNDFECRNFAYRHTDTSTATTKSNADGTQETVNADRNINYNAYTFVADRTNYQPGSNPRAPRPVVIPASQAYAGLNAMEYWYTVYSTAARPDPLNPTNPVQQSNAKTVLQMDFKSRVVPLFQFAVFYDGDLEMNSSSNMTIGGRVHTNANFYVQPFSTNNAITTTFLGSITAVGSIYNRVDSFAGTSTHPNSTRVLMTGTDCSVAANCLWLPNFSAGTRASGAAGNSPLTAGELAPFGTRVQSGAFSPQIRRLQTPPPGFLRKRNYFKSISAADGSAVGAYFAKADMRLEMVPDRDVTSTAAAPWTRDPSRIPFNFTSVTTVAGTMGTCTTTPPPTDAVTGGIPSTTGDPAANYIDPDRNNPTPATPLTTTLHCNVFTKGQLQSLRQPVMVLTNINQTDTTLRDAALPTSATPNPALGTESTILGRPTLPAAITGLSVTAANQPKILRALRIAIASTPSPIALDTLRLPINDASLTTVRTEFRRLLQSLGTSIISTADVDTLSSATATVTPNQIAAIGGAWFMPAPIQRIETGNLQDGTNRNPRRSGFYDGRERRWITMLQTNIASLSVWNRDGTYVESADAVAGTDPNKTAPYLADTLTKNAAFNAGNDTTNSTNGLAFDRAAASVFTTPRGLQVLGLGSNDTTEGGLVLHATVRDDLNGNGTISAAEDVTVDTANPIAKRDAVGNLIDDNGNPMAAPGLIVDYPRRYRNGATYQSPFGFAFNGGNYLPGPLTLVTDQAIYTQGDFNNNGAAQFEAGTTPNIAPDANRLPASIIGDTITVLSNDCLSTTSVLTTTNHLAVPAGQLKCGLPRANTGSSDVPVAGNTATYYPVSRATAVNAAFLSNTDQSTGNLPSAALATAANVSRGFGGTQRFSGAINNYMRMLEDWGGGGRFFNYSGSFVSLGTPLESSGVYVGGGGAFDSAGAAAGSSYYNIPGRNFNFDTNFNTFNLLPPLPPTAIYLQQNVFKRTYE